MNQIKSAIEAVIFAAGKAVTVRELSDLATAMIPEGIDRNDVEKALRELQAEWQEWGRGFTLAEVAGGYEFRTRTEFSPWIAALTETRPQRLSTPAAESLAVIAYRQPITRADLESLRGVDCAGVLKSLGDRNLIRVIGRKEEPGRPLLYGTTKEFLELFGLNDLGELPPLKEFEEKIKQTETIEVAPLAVSDLASTPEDLMVLASEDRQALEVLEETLTDLKKVERSYQQEETPTVVDLERTETDITNDTAG